MCKEEIRNYASLTLWCIVDVPNQDIEYTYQAGSISSIKDHGLDQLIGYGYDSESQPIVKGIAKLSTGEPIASYSTSYDELHRINTTENTYWNVRNTFDQLNYDTKYDANSNRKRINATFKPGGYTSSTSLPIMQQSYHFRYDDADRVTCYTGPNIINRYTYAGGFRTHEQQCDPSGNVYEFDLTPAPDGQVQYITGDNGIKIVCNFDNLGRINQYVEQYKYPLYSNETTQTHNANGWMNSSCYTEQDYSSKEQPNTLSGTSILNFTGQGLPLTEITTTTITKENETTKGVEIECSTDKLNFDYFGSDSWLPNTTSGTRTLPAQGKTINATAQTFYDANGTINGKLRSADEPDSDRCPNVYFHSTPEGQILSKQYIRNDNGIFNYVISNEFFHDTEGHLLGGYKTEYAPFSINDVIFKWIEEYYHVPGIKDLILPKDEFTINNYVHPIAHPNPINRGAKNNPLGFEAPKIPEGLQVHIVKPGETLQSISEAKYGDTCYAEQIATVNGLLPNFTPAPGYILNLPYVYPSFNKAHNHTPYDRFLSIISGHLSPHFAIKPEKHNEAEWLAQVAKIVALAIVIMAAPHIAGFLLGTAAGGAFVGGILGTAEAGAAHTVLTGMIAAMGDAGAQGLAIGMGAQKDFSFNEMFETAVSAGVSTNLGSVNSLLDLAKHATTIGTSAAAAQLFEMKMGTRDTFDYKAVGMQVAAAVANVGISKWFNGVFKPSHGTPAATNAASVVANNAIGGMVYETPLDIKQMAVQGIGSVVGSAAGGAVAAAELETSPATNDYSNQEIAEEEAQTDKVIKLKVDDPKLNLPDARKVRYALSEINRKQINQSNDNVSQVQAQENARLTRMTRWTVTSSANSFEYCPIDSASYSARETPNHYINGIPKDAIEPIYPELLLWGATDVVKLGLAIGKFIPKIAAGVSGLVKNGLWSNTTKSFAKPIEQSMEKELATLKPLQSPREFLLNNVEDSKLYRMVDMLYRPTAKYGSGSTADAIRHELNTGELLSKTGHIQKGVEVRNALSDMIGSGRLNAKDTSIASSIRKDLQDALTEKPWDKIYIGRQKLR